MEKSEQKVGKVFLVFAGICIVALPLIVFSAFSFESEDIKPDIVKTEGNNFDQSGQAIFINYDQLSREYLAGTSTERTLSSYYDRRQYPGSPPFIPHKVEEADLAQIECLACHARGGWSEELKGHTPVTPHPEQIACRQCHIEQTDAKLFVDIDWMSVSTPRLGRSDLPGAPPPIPHELQMRGNCIACHVGPGTVASIRVEHPSRGNCRQCHVPETNAGLFSRKSK
ncbi:MAG: nitrate reductase cytochrome c-type subunit [Deltaproteobacteria bacterium]|nr:nitrate reductase cytochrome c-type subunit [Deltaproteobacteria bacterium]